MFAVDLGFVVRSPETVLNPDCPNSAVSCLSSCVLSLTLLPLYTSSLFPMPCFRGEGDHVDYSCTMLIFLFGLVCSFTHRLVDLKSLNQIPNMAELFIFLAWENYAKTVW